jgi:hypothetical protein
MGTRVVALVLGAVVLVGCERREDFTVRTSVKSSGIEISRFTSAMAPALPDEVNEAADFQFILNKAGIDAPGASAAVEPAGRDGYRWYWTDGTSVTVTTRICKDKVRCLDKVVVSPTKKQQLKNRAANLPNAAFVESSDYLDWPYTIDYGMIRCRKGMALTIENEQGIWALNGVAKTWVPGTEWVREIQKPDPVNGDFGLLMNSRALSEKANGLCED